MTSGRLGNVRAEGRAGARAMGQMSGRLGAESVTALAGPAEESIGDVVTEVAADPGQVVDDVDAHLFQRLARADSEQQELRRVDRATTRITSRAAVASCSRPSRR